MYTEPTNAADPLPMYYGFDQAGPGQTTLRPAPHVSRDTRARRAYRAYRMAQRARKAYVRRLEIHGHDGMLSADDRRVLRNLRKAGR